MTDRNSLNARFTKTGARILNDKEERAQKAADKRKASKMIISNIKDLYRWQKRTPAEICEYLVNVEHFDATAAEKLVKKTLNI